MLIKNGENLMSLGKKFRMICELLFDLCIK